jgi:hypothetical protein
MYMGMMSIIISHFIHSYGKTSHKTPMPIRAKVMGMTRKRKVMPIRGQPLLNQCKANPTLWKLGLHD